MNLSQNSFITNQEKLLSDIIQGILPNTKSVDILVGYFYFSGYTLLSEKLRDKNVRVLVGLDVDTEISKHLREIESLTRDKTSRGQIRKDYFEQFVGLFNDTDFLDSADKLKSFKLFYDKIKNGSLEIRKTEDPCHAKMYVFDYNDDKSENGEMPGCIITGSSNLSYAGLAGRIEINARFNDKQPYIDAKHIFNELWNKSVVIVDNNSIEDFDDNVIKHIWYEKLYSPYLMYIRVLDEYFSIPSIDNVLTPYDISNSKYSNLKYQTDAVKLSLKSIENHNGVIISDVVGLGKSIIASTVAANLKLRSIIICPPHLIKQWEVYKDEFRLTASIFSSGQIENALSHYLEIKKKDEQILIIVDEAHRYRNEYTKDYAALHNLCTANKVILLTATPFNNRPDDIYSMIKLFQIPSKSTLKTVENLGESFKDLINTYKSLEKEQRDKKKSDNDLKIEFDKIAASIRSIISPLIIRRSRIDLQEIPEYKKDLENQHIELVIPSDPIELEYNLGSLKDLYLDTLDLINETENRVDDKYRFKAARYNPVDYIPENLKQQFKDDLEKKTGTQLNLLIGRQKNIAKFMRRLLVRRFESSVASFKSSLEYMIKSSENVLDWIEKVNKIPVYKKGELPEVDEFYDSSEDGMDEIDEAFDRYSKRGFFEIDMKYINNHFIEDVESDIALLKSIKNRWFGETNQIKVDPKLDSFKRILHKKLKEDPNRKLIVFTEFADTANYLSESLSEEFPIFKYTSNDASNINKDRIRANFDAGLDKKMQKNDYQILIATDAISEGYNLHRAGAIFNYDIPYNPTRVIQRIGRINRVNKRMFKELYIYNYFPTDIGESETRTKEISTIKMFMIHAIMGEDTKALTKDEDVQAFFKDRYKKELAKDEQSSWDSYYRKELDEVKGTEAYLKAMSIPHRSRTGRIIEKPYKGVLLFGKKGNDYVFKIGNTDEMLQLTAEQALNVFKAMADEKPQKLSGQFDEIYQKVKNNLFRSGAKNKSDKQQQSAVSKIKVMMRSNIINSDYLEDLLNVALNDGLSGYEIRYINQLMPCDYKKVKNVISQEYLDRIVSTTRRTTNEDETLIITEELQ